MGNDFGYTLPIHAQLLPDLVISLRVKTVICLSPSIKACKCKLQDSDECRVGIVWLLNIMCVFCTFYKAQLAVVFGFYIQL